MLAWFASPPSDEPIIPEEEELLKVLRAIYRDPSITTTKAMHQVRPQPHVPASARLSGALRPTSSLFPGLTRVCLCAQAVLDQHPKWTVNLKRVRKLLGKVVGAPPATTSPARTPAADSEASPDVSWVEEEVDDWCVISVANGGLAAKNVVAPARRRGRS